MDKGIVTSIEYTDANGNSTVEKMVLERSNPERSIDTLQIELSAFVLNSSRMLNWGYDGHWFSYEIAANVFRKLHIAWTSIEEELQDKEYA